MRRVREEMGLTNVMLMLPFVPAGRRGRPGAGRGWPSSASSAATTGSQVYAMCEIPNNVILVDEFAKRFDGFSIGSNDLTQLTLGVDRDSEIVAFDYDERDPGVKAMIRLAVEGCQRATASTPASAARRRRTTRTWRSSSSSWASTR